MSIDTTSSAHERHCLRLLDAFESESDVSQRSMSSELGIALGLTNLLVKRLVRKGWVRMIHLKPGRVRYLVTPTGLAEKARLSRAYFDYSLQFYKQTRDRIQCRFAELSSSWPTRSGSDTRKRIIFYGAGEVAEIGYICLAETDLELVSVVDGARTKPFFGLNVVPPHCLEGLAVGDKVFDRLVVMSFGNSEALRAELSSLRVPSDRTFWL